MTRHELRVPGLPEPISHYTDAVLAGELLFISGVLAVDASGTLVDGDVVAQAEQVFALIGRLLRAAGGKPADVVKVSVYLLDIEERPLINSAPGLLRAGSPGEHPGRGLTPGRPRSPTRSGGDGAVLHAAALAVKSTRLSAAS